jgi:hypothetical protein
MTAMPAYMRDDGLWVIPRDEFCSKRFHYKPGQHVVFAGPTQRAGKTTMAFALLEYCATPECPAYVAVCKPDDAVSAREGKRLGFRRVSTWPVKPNLSEAWDGKPPGYLIWPQFGDINTDVERTARITAALLGDRYTQGVKHKKGILVLDDTMIKSKILGLDREMVTIIAMAGAMGVGGWFFVQKPTDSGRAAIWSYGNSEHIFISNDPEKRNRQRYDEIGGVDPHVVERASLSLKPYQFLYLKRTEGFMCIVDSK